MVLQTQPQPDQPVSEDGNAQTEARFGPLELVAVKPAISLADGAQFLDLAGDGRPDVVQFAGPDCRVLRARPRTSSGSRSRAFRSLPNLDWDDPNLVHRPRRRWARRRLITEHDVLAWHPSLGEDGFGPARRVSAAMGRGTAARAGLRRRRRSRSTSPTCRGDGLTDLVRIRNGEVCYWPNLGYGRFGAEGHDGRRAAGSTSPICSTSAASGWPISTARARPTSSTCTRDGARIYFNQSGNSWSARRSHCRGLPAGRQRSSSVQALDLLGNGTACLVWSSPLPGDARRPLRYIDLMGGQKPHLLVKTINNLGAETGSSTRPRPSSTCRTRRPVSPGSPSCRSRCMSSSG